MQNCAAVVYWILGFIWSNFGWLDIEEKTSCKKCNDKELLFDKELKDKSHFLMVLSIHSIIK